MNKSEMNLSGVNSLRLLFLLLSNEDRERKILIASTSEGYCGD